MTGSGAAAVLGGAPDGERLGPDPAVPPASGHPGEGDQRLHRQRPGPLRGAAPVPGRQHLPAGYTSQDLLQAGGAGQGSVPEVPPGQSLDQERNRPQQF